MGFEKTKVKSRKSVRLALTQQVHILGVWMGFQDPMKSMAYVSR